MSFRYEIQQACLTPAEIIAEFPDFKAYSEQAVRHQAAIKSILSGRSRRLLLVVGPCSAWPVAATLEYARRLASLNQHVSDHIVCVMRVYTQKPRTSLGWRGLGVQPDLNLPQDINAGTRAAISLFTSILDLGLPIADEILCAYQIPLLSPLLSWAAIGARSSLDQEHRIYASCLGCPVGIKNPVFGPIDSVIDGVLAARASHTAILQANQVRSLGNPDAHIVLRGADAGPNYSPSHLSRLRAGMRDKGIADIPVLIDASHDNARVSGVKSLSQQVEVVREVMSARANDPLTANLVKGFMIESFLESGHQVLDLDDLSALHTGGLSITDPCLGWKETEALILSMADLLAKQCRNSAIPA